MTIKSLCIISACAAMVWTSQISRAEEYKEMTGVDFMTDWPTLVGKPVAITDGLVFGASDRFTMLQVQGGSARLDPPWVDREDLRYLFKRCAGMSDEPACFMTVR